MLCGIYEIRCIVTNICYIGSSKNLKRRLYDHKRELSKNIHVNPYLQNAWNKYGEDNFCFTVLEYCLPENRLEIEQTYIDKQFEGIHTFNLCRLVSSPSKGFISEETKIKIGNANRGRSMSDDQKKKLSIAHTGKKRNPPSEETRLKMSLAQRGKTGRKKTQEEKDKIAKSMQGRKVSEETRAKSSATHKTLTAHHVPHTKETKEKISKALTGKSYKKRIK